MCALRLWSCVGVVLVLTAVFTGCGGSGPKTYPISGTVNYNGQPLPEGTIILFAPGEVDESGKISGGKFAFSAKKGSKRVKILASRQEGPVDPQMGAAPLKQYIPAKYSSEETELTMEVKDSGKNVFPYDLTGP
jgi:hypothetical protein